MLDFVQRLRQLDAEVEALRATLIRLQHDLRLQAGSARPVGPGGATGGPVAATESAAPYGAPLGFRDSEFLKAYA